MGTVEEQVEVRAPIGMVFACWSCPECFPMFMAGVDSVERIDSARTRWVVSVGGIRRRFEAALAVRIPEEHLEWQTTDGTVRHHGTVRFQQVSDSTTRVGVHLEWEPFGVVEHLSRALGLDRRQVRADLLCFKDLVEAEPRRAAAMRANSGIRDIRPVSGISGISGISGSVLPSKAE